MLGFNKMMFYAHLLQRKQQFHAELTIALPITAIYCRQPAILGYRRGAQFISAELPD